MGLQRDTRGVSEVLGAVLVFGLVVALIAVIQIHGIPPANEQVELNHNQEVDDDFAELHSGLLNAGAGESYTATVTLGTTYPNRFLFINPPAPQGSLRTSGLGPLDWEPPGEGGDTLEDVCGIGEDANALTFEPDYNHLTGVGTHGYENTIQYQAVDDNLAEHRQGLVSGRTIHLRPLVG